MLSKGSESEKNIAATTKKIEFRLETDKHITHYMESLPMKSN